MMPVARRKPWRLRQRLVHRVVKKAASDDDGEAGRERVYAAMRLHVWRFAGGFGAVHGHDNGDVGFNL